MYKFHLSVARFTVIRQMALRVPSGLSAAVENVAIVVVVVRICWSAYNATTNYWTPNDRS